MAQRIGKYKISKRESAMSLVDGGVINGPITGAEGVVFSESGDVTSGAVYNGSAMAIPANSVITSLGCVVKTACVADSGTWGVRFGTASNGAELAALVVDNLEGAQVGVAAGIGTSTITQDMTALGGASVIVQVAGTPYATAARSAFGTVVSAGGTITAGNVIFWAKYITIA